MLGAPLVADSPPSAPPPSPPCLPAAAPVDPAALPARRQLQGQRSLWVGSQPRNSSQNLDFIDMWHEKELLVAMFHKCIEYMYLARCTDLPCAGSQAHQLQRLDGLNPDAPIPSVASRQGDAGHAALTPEAQVAAQLSSPSACAQQEVLCCSQALKGVTGQSPQLHGL